MSHFNHFPTPNKLYLRVLFRPHASSDLRAQNTRTVTRFDQDNAEFPSGNLITITSLIAFKCFCAMTRLTKPEVGLLVSGLFKSMKCVTVAKHFLPLCNSEETIDHRLACGSVRLAHNTVGNTIDDSKIDADTHRPDKRLQTSVYL